MHFDRDLHDEHGRLAALERLAVLDTGPEEPFDNVVELVRTVLGVPYVAVSLLDEDRQWFKARSGFEVTETPRENSFCNHTVMQRDPLVVEDATLDSRFCDHPAVIGDLHIRSYIGVPLRTSDGYNIGALCVVDVKARQFSADELAILANFARIIVNELELRRIAGRDQLTGVLTRRGLIEKAENEIMRYRRYGRIASMLLIDVDHFKTINDTHGHPVGDRVLKTLAKTLSKVCRPTDVVARLGGEEFAILLPETGRDQAYAIAERLRQTIADQSVSKPGAARLWVTASFGIAELSADMASAEEWIAAADAPLYEAKRTGRNRSVMA